MTCKGADGVIRRYAVIPLGRACLLCLCACYHSKNEQPENQKLLSTQIKLLTSFILSDELAAVTSRAGGSGRHLSPLGTIRCALVSWFF
jgi:hypothetical protein